MADVRVDLRGAAQVLHRRLRFGGSITGRQAGELDKRSNAVLLQPEGQVARVVLVKHAERAAVAGQKSQVAGRPQAEAHAVKGLFHIFSSKNALPAER